MGAEFDDADYARLRHCMVNDQLCARHVSDELVLAVMEKIPRHMFVPAVHRRAAYDDGPVPIGLGQTISQPYMVARMTELLRLSPTDRVLEIGTGSGYQTAVLAELVESVWTLERHQELAQRADDLLRLLGYRNVTVVTGDGTLGFAEAAPYDAIIVTAAAPHVPQCLRDQLGCRGRMVIPVAAGYNQDLRLIERLPAEPAFRETSILGCVFVPLIGEEGYAG
ncbi:MAG: protein-L-isoaspartate(D-aspartate) O-methyltransferase [Thermoleophilia bacterium]|nr:protein-L-isoaspartate(D-aspartate) O-methyltransferase [Thermoleophilia bacterium]